MKSFQKNWEALGTGSEEKVKMTTAQRIGGSQKLRIFFIYFIIACLSAFKKSEGGQSQ